MSFRTTLASIVAGAIGLIGVGATPRDALASPPKDSEDSKEPVAILLQNPGIVDVASYYYVGQELTLTTIGDVPDGAYFDLDGDGTRDGDETAAPTKITLNAAGRQKYTLNGSNNERLDSIEIDVKEMPKTVVEKIVEVPAKATDAPVIITPTGVERLAILGGAGAQFLSLAERLGLPTNGNDSLFNPTGFDLNLYLEGLYRLSQHWRFGGSADINLGIYGQSDVLQNGSVIGNAHGTLSSVNLSLHVDAILHKYFSLYALAGFDLDSFNFTGSVTPQGHTKAQQFKDSTTDATGNAGLGVLLGDRAHTYLALLAGVGGSSSGRHSLTGAEFNAHAEFVWGIVRGLRFAADAGYSTDLGNMNGDRTVFELSQYGLGASVEWNVANSGFCARLAGSYGSRVLKELGGRITQDDSDGRVLLSLGYCRQTERGDEQLTSRRSRGPSADPGATTRTGPTKQNVQGTTDATTGVVNDAQPSSAALISMAERPGLTQTDAVPATAKPEEQRVPDAAVPVGLSSQQGQGLDESVLMSHLYLTTSGNPLFNLYVTGQLGNNKLLGNKTPYEFYNGLREYIRGLPEYTSDAFNRQVRVIDPLFLHNWLENNADKQTVVIPSEIRDAFQRNPSAYDYARRYLESRGSSVRYQNLLNGITKAYNLVIQDCLDAKVCTGASQIPIN